ncbi:MAG: enoyl-CoA hydratase/isomerase family protein [Phycisphaeraceae bacterium]|nr:enoyl-CoA hydratase/isomerase family protein [Phycisphaeraceae bacterium]MCB9848060.1 enoyl-CoA hydratase/isomerase family protein [Phycisphaeraceae bacterium]
MAANPLPIHRGASPDVATITLEQPGRPVVVLDRALLHRLEETLDQLPDDIGGLVIASASDRVFVAGADLNEINGLSDDELDDYLATGQRIFGRLAALPCSVVAAVNGAALGGGLELAMHCDHIVGLRPAPDARPYLVGLPEAGLGICPGWGGCCLLPARLDPATAIELTATGKPMKADQAHDAGLLEQLADSHDDLLALARRLAAQPKPARAIPGEPLHLMQRPREQAVQAIDKAACAVERNPAANGVIGVCRVGAEQGWQAALDAERATLIRLRQTDTAKERISAFLNKSAAKA